MVYFCHTVEIRYPGLSQILFFCISEQSIIKMERIGAQKVGIILNDISLGFLLPHLLSGLVEIILVTFPLLSMDSYFHINLFYGNFLPSLFAYNEVIV